MVILEDGNSTAWQQGLEAICDTWHGAGSLVPAVPWIRSYDMLMHPAKEVIKEIDFPGTMLIVSADALRHGVLVRQWWRLSGEVAAEVVMAAVGGGLELALERAEPALHEVYLYTTWRAKSALLGQAQAASWRLARPPRWHTGPAG